MSDIELPEPDFSLDGGKTPCWYEHSLRAAILADRAMRPKNAQGAYAYAVYFPGIQREELVHDLDDLDDDMTNYEHTVTPLFATEPSKPVQAEAPNNRPSPEWYRDKIAETLDDDFTIGPATQQAEAPTASNERLTNEKETPCVNSMSSGAMPTSVSASITCTPPLDGTSSQSSERKLDLYDEIECDLPYLFGRASIEGHEAGQRLAAQVRTKMQAARAALATQQFAAINTSEQETPT